MHDDDTPDNWQRLASETREAAVRISLIPDKNRLLEMAEQYERLAAAAEEKQRKQADLRE